MVGQLSSQNSVSAKRNSVGPGKLRNSIIFKKTKTKGAKA